MFPNIPKGANPNDYRLDHNGWLVVPPVVIPEELAIRAEWFINGEKYGYQYAFSGAQIIDTKVDILKQFIRAANEEIHHILQQLPKDTPKRFAL